MKLREAFLSQAASNRSLGSPFTARVLEVLAESFTPGTSLADRLLTWEAEDIGPGGASLPLRVLGGLHALVLLGKDAGLTSVYPPAAAPADEVLQRAIQMALQAHEGFLNDWINTAPQTNEVRRSAAMIAAGHYLQARFDLPVETYELGASGGLNLHWDQYALQHPGGQAGAAEPALMLMPDWDGDGLPAEAPTVIARQGVDLNPLDPSDPDDALRLMAFLWADQPERMERTRAAMSVAETRVDAGDASAWLEGKLTDLTPGRLHLVYHTVAWQYFPQDTKDRCLTAMRNAGATAETPLARLSMEADDLSGPAGQGAALTLTLWPGEVEVPLGRIDFHGRWIRWAPGLS